MKREMDEEPIEQILAELAAFLLETEDIMLPSLEARVRDVRTGFQKAQDVLNKLQLRVERLSRKE